MRKVEKAKARIFLIEEAIENLEAKRVEIEYGLMNSYLIEYAKERNKTIDELISALEGLI